MTPCTWNDLRELRANGMKPGFPVIVTTERGIVERNFGDIGAMVIRHEPGTPMPVELLSGLQVWLLLGCCDRGQAVIRVMNAKGVRPQDLQCWCYCAHELRSNPIGCEIDQFWGGEAA